MQLECVCIRTSQLVFKYLYENKNAHLIALSFLNNVADGDIVVNVSEPAITVPVQWASLHKQHKRKATVNRGGAISRHPALI